MLLLLAALFALALAPAIVRARREFRDGTRRDDLGLLKHTMEMFFNAHETYPAPQSGEESCATTDRADDWLFGAKGILADQELVERVPRDPLAAAGWQYRYCVTEQDDAGATAWYVQARLENARDAQHGFDPEQGHNYYFRITRDGDATYFDICGGTSTCAPEERTAGQ